MMGDWKKLYKEGIQHYQAKRYAAAAQSFEKARVAAEQAGERHRLAEVLNDLGVARRELGEWDAAQWALEAAYTLFGELQDTRGQAQALGNLASVHEGRGDYAAAAEAYRESARMFEALGESELAMYTRQALSRLHLEHKQWLTAIAAYEEGIEAMPNSSLKKKVLQRLMQLPGHWLLGGK
ncbi:MAG: tetratricopeptide repeat protein [Anaerolineae bacterium]